MQMTVRYNNPLRRQRPEQILADINAHLEQTCFGILREYLVLVVIHLAQFRLTDSLYGCVAVDLSQHSDFKSPVAGDPVGASQINAHREFAGKRISKTV